MAVIAPSILSVALALKLTKSLLEEVVLEVILAGKLKTGLTVSTTFTRKLPVVELPYRSLAVQYTVDCVIPKVLPEEGLQTIIGDLRALSVAVTLKLITVPAGPVASAVMFAGTKITGASVSEVFLPPFLFSPAALEILLAAIIRANIKVNIIRMANPLGMVKFNDEYINNY